ncbi:MAG TPA: beta-L-arabinofuranosidase domain-containing protein [Abditibacteriaceae bacterium]|jgi:hypothetical protein
MPQQNRTVVVDTTDSPGVRLKPVPLDAVKVNDEFWAPRRRINREQTLPSQFRHCESTGRLDNLRRAAGKMEGDFEGIYFNDSDVWKWIEAAGWTLAADHDVDNSKLLEMLSVAVREAADAQTPEGYLDSYFMRERASQRWTNLRDMHELYCAGHFIQGAVAHYRATNDETLLNVAKRLADHIISVFGDGDGKKRMTDGHEEIEMALVELARTVGEPEYLRQAQFFLDVRGHGTIGGGAYHQDHLPFRELHRMEGHAVRAVYLNCGAADILAETGDQTLRPALNHLFHNAAHRQMYVSGGLGSRYEGEAFGKDYELPNERAYAETCAAIGSVMWNWRMLMFEGDARYADMLETALYNAVLCGLSLDGQQYFYQNPLADDGTHRRQEWFGCACCPPNVARLLAQLPGYFYSTSSEGAWVHLYASGRAQMQLPQHGTLTLQQRTRYPWDGEIEIEIETAPSRETALYLRVPAWCENGASLEINGEAHTQVLVPGTYAEVRRVWQSGDVLKLHLPMPVRSVEAHPYALENVNCVALLRGPLLYCLESVDNPDVDLRDIVVPRDAVYAEQWCARVLGGVVMLQGEAAVSSHAGAFGDRLYHTVNAAAEPPTRTIQISAVPYFAWANREPGQMRVWLRTA